MVLSSAHTGVPVSLGLCAFEDLCDTQGEDNREPVPADHQQENKWEKISLAGKQK